MPKVLSTISGTLCSCATCIPPQHRHRHGNRYLEIAYLSYLTNRTDVVLGVSDGLHKYGLGILINSRSKCGGFIRSDKLDPNSVFLQKHYAKLSALKTHTKRILSAKLPLNWLYV